MWYEQVGGEPLRIRTLRRQLGLVWPKAKSVEARLWPREDLNLMLLTSLLVLFIHSLYLPMAQRCCLSLILTLDVHLSMYPKDLRLIKTLKLRTPPIAS